MYYIIYIFIIYILYIFFSIPVSPPAADTITDMNVSILRKDEIRGFFHHFLCSGMDAVACYRSGLKITSVSARDNYATRLLPVICCSGNKVGVCPARNESSNATTWPPADRLTCISDFNPR